MSSGTIPHLSSELKPRAVYPVQSAASHSASPTNPKTIKDEPSSPESSHSEARRRRIGRSVTANACTNCKKARSKALKEQLMREIQRLQAENRSLTQRNSFLGDKNDVMEGILQSLKDNEQVGTLVSRLVHGDNHEAILDLVTQTPILIDTPLAAPQQLGGALQTLPQQSDLNSEMLSWMDLNLRDPRCQIEDNLGQDHDALYRIGTGFSVVMRPLHRP
ncbi:MAG: hypothetical protein Q9169_002281 [Polycauliona sp. 2 TL-2023]